MKLVGIGGTNGAGKDSLGDILSEHGWLFVSGSEILRQEAKKRGLAIERQNLRAISKEWREQFGLGVLVDKAVEIFNSADKQYEGLAISSLRNPGEADRVHELSGKVVWVDADPKLRYQRIYSRARSSEDQKTFEQFIAEEQAEMSSKDRSDLSTSDVKARADIFIKNDTNSIEEFRHQALAKIN